MNIVSTIRDVDERLLRVAQKQDFSKLESQLSYIAYTFDTSVKTVEFLKNIGFNPIEGGLYGESRKLVLE